MNVSLLTVPYDSGHEAQRMGNGPLHFVQHGIAAHIGVYGHAVEVERIGATTPFHTEIATAFELYRRLAERVRHAAAQGNFPLVLGGNCGSMLGGIAGVDAANVGLIWFDAHGDFNTPETTTSGFLDGMGLAIATGQCWRGLAATIPGFQPLPEAHAIHVGGRDFDAAEGAALHGSNIAVVEAADMHQRTLRDALVPALAALREQVQAVYVHLDLDVLDPQAVAPANQFPAPDGLTVEQVAEAMELIHERFSVRGASVTSYDPSYDQQDRMLHAGERLIAALIPR